MAKMQDQLQRIAERYLRFAIDEARGESKVYERFALAVAASRELLIFLAGLPSDKRQPNLFLAAVRHLCGVPESENRLAEIVRREHRRIRALMLARTTQTNEPGRCSVLLPLLARLPPPLALLEVGASAGLCLIPDRYGYDYGAQRIDPPAFDGVAAPVFPCAIRGAVPLPTRVPEIAWRAGLDLNPIDLRSAEDAAWLETLVWPGQTGRAERLRAAIAVARLGLPNIVRGNLLTELQLLIATAPKDATLVVFHTAVLPYVTPQASRDRFAAIVQAADAFWIS
ncbi:MAG TPA: DUF2332 domain-containing protein, partial [Stellaceae bacterium]|nr:DUF2332 domain-containing protein [Stellaceae bacterium]